MEAAKKATGYPSIDKPWLKYYTEEAINAKLPECTIYEYLFENNKDHLNDTALIYFGREITYKTLFDNIEKTAAALDCLGIKKGDVVTIQSLSLPQVIYMVYALSKIGAIANLIYATSTADEVKENLSQTKSKLYVAIDSIYNHFKNDIRNEHLEKIVLISIDDEMSSIVKTVYKIKTKSKPTKNNGIVCNWKSFISLGKSNKTTIGGCSSDSAIMVYTGGTTGKSKGVMLSNYNLNVGALQYLHCGFERHKTFLSVLPPFIAFGVTVSMHMPLSFGLKTVLGVCADPSDVASFVEKNTINYVICGTAQADKMRDKLSRKKDLSSLICFSVGGDVLTPKLEEDLNIFLAQHNSKIKVAQGYAMSETSASTACSTYTPDVIIHKDKSVGIPLVYTNIKIVDTETNTELPYNQSGEICINSPCIMMGYYKNPEETDNILKKHQDGSLWVHTGDIGNVDEDGFISIVGRIKRMILTLENGIFHKVFPKTIEDVFLKCNLIKAVSIVGRPSKDTLNDLVAFIVLEDNVSKKDAICELEKIAKENLKSFERPIIYSIEDKLPLTTIGKVNYRELEERAQQ